MLAGAYGLCYITNRALSPWSAVRTLTIAPGAPAAAPAADRRTLTVVTYNIAHGRGLAASNWSADTRRSRPQRLRDIAQLLRQINADVVVLNEVDFDCVWAGHRNAAAILADEAGYPHRLEQRNLDMAVPFAHVRFGNAVLSRYPIRDAKRLAFPGASTLESIAVGRKQGALCTIATPAGPVRLAAVHLEHRDEAVRVRAAGMLEQLLRDSPLPLILAGDFNSAPVGFPHTPTDSKGQTAVSLLLAGGRFTTLGAQAPPAPAQLTFPAQRPDQCIDWVMVSPPLRVVEEHVIDSRLSDHRPVVALIEWRR